MSKTANKILSAKGELDKYNKNDFVKFIAEMTVILSIKETPHKLVVDELYSIAKDKFSDLSIGEMRLAFRMNMLQELESFTDHFQLFDIKFFSTVLLQFRKVRGKAKQEVKAIEETQYRPVMSQTEAEFAWKETILKQFATYKESGVFSCFMPIRLYKNFEERGLIKLSREEKDKIFEEAKQQVLKGAKITRLNPRNKEHLNDLSSSIKRIEENKANSSDQNKIKSAACEIAIRSFYDSISDLKL